MSRHFSIQLENEVGTQKYSKPYGIVPYTTMPPTRILSSGPVKCMVRLGLT